MGQDVLPGTENRACPVLWVVVPCLDEQEALPAMARALADRLGSLAADGRIASTSRVLLVDDGSGDATWDVIRDLSVDIEAPGLFTGIRLAHNEGHQNAVYAGLMHALDHGCDCAVSLDADMQDDVDAVGEMLRDFSEGAEIVYGVRSNRDGDSRFKRWSARRYYRLMRRLGTEVVCDSADYRLMGAASLAALSRYGEVNLFLRGIVPSLGFRTSKVYYRRRSRVAGRSKYSLGKMVSLAAQGITSFSAKPMHAILGLGLLTLLVAVAMLAYVIVESATGGAVSGWSSLMVSLWLIGGLVMVSLGITGEYVGKVYLESKHRPRYVVEEDLDEAGDRTSDDDPTSTSHRSRTRTRPRRP